MIRASLDQLGEDREQRPAEDHQRDHREQVVVHDQRALPRCQRLEVVVRRQPPAPPAEQQHRGADGQRQQPKEVRADVRLRERVHGLDQPAAHVERPEDRERERREHQREVPELQHPSALLHHQRVHERRHRQQRQQRGVLDRVPAPVAAPAERRVGPPPAEDVADAQQQPRQQRPAPHATDPAPVDLPRDQRRRAERERHCGAHEPREHEWRVDQHRAIDEQRIEADAVLRRHGADLERRGEEHRRQQERRQNRAPGRRRVRRAPRDPRHGDDDERREHQREQPRPEQQRAGLPAVQRRPLHVRQHRRRGDRGDVRDREVVGQQRVRERAEGQRRKGGSNDDRSPRRGEQWWPRKLLRGDGCGDREQARGQRREQRGGAERCREVHTLLVRGQPYGAAIEASSSSVTNSGSWRMMTESATSPPSSVATPSTTTKARGPNRLGVTPSYAISIV